MAVGHSTRSASAWSLKGTCTQHNSWWHSALKPLFREETRKGQDCQKLILHKALCTFVGSIHTHIHTMHCCIINYCCITNRGLDAVSIRPLNQLSCFVLTTNFILSLMEPHYLPYGHLTTKIPVSLYACYSEGWEVCFNCGVPSYHSVYGLCRHKASQIFPF